MKCNFAEVLKGAYAIVDVDELERLMADEVEVALGGSCEKDR